MAIFECTIEDITFRNDTNGWTVLRVRIDRDRVSAVGIMPFVGTGERVRLTGEWIEHPDYGKQLKVTACESIKPATKSGIEKYLASGMIKGIGPAKAKALTDHFGSFAKLKNADEAALRAVTGISEKDASAVWKHFHPKAE